MKFLRSFGYALTGIKVALTEQRNLRIQFMGLSTVIAAGWYFSVTGVEWCLLLLSSAVVIGLELVNTAIENLTDLVTKEKLPLAAKVKDIAAGAVLVAAVVALAVGVIIFANYV